MTPALHAYNLLMVERAVREHPGRTCQELAGELGIGDYATLRECLGELERAGKVHRSGHLNTCRVTRKPSATWLPGDDPLDSAHTLPADLVSGYAIALEKLAPPIGPRAEQALPVPASDTTIPA